MADRKSGSSLTLIVCPDCKSSKTRLTGGGFIVCLVHIYPLFSVSVSIRIH